MRKLTIISMTISTALSSAYVSAILPQDGKIKEGTATINTVDKVMTIQQTTPRVNIEWNSFNIGEKNTVKFEQPDSTSIAYNRVMGGNASHIQGKLDANGRVFLANPNGILFSETASVNVGALLATTKDVEKISENQKSIEFKRRNDATKDSGNIVNKGKISVNGENGFVVLVGDGVTNEGEITAKPFTKTKKVKGKYCTSIWNNDINCNTQGAKWIEYEKEETVATQSQIILGAGKSFTLELDGSSVSVDIDENTVNSLIANKGIIISEDGYIQLTTKGKSELFNNVINNDGVLQANNLSINNSGNIELFADDIRLGKKADIQAEKLTFKAKKNHINVHSDNAKLTAREITFDKGSIYDPLNVTIQGTFSRKEDKTLFDDATMTLKSKVNIDVDGALTIADKKIENHSFISNEALGSLLANTGEVYLKATDIDWSGKMTVDSFRNTDAVLQLSTKLNTKKPTSIGNMNFHELNVDTTNGRLFIATDLFGNRLAKEGNESIRLKDVKLNLNNGAIGLGRNGRRVDIDKSDFDNFYFLEDSQRKPFDIYLNNIQLDKIDDFVIVGGFKKVDIENLTHKGRGNFYIYGGYMYNMPNARYDYAIFDIKERILRTKRDHSHNRWKYNSNQDSFMNNEFWRAYDQWTAVYPYYDRKTKEVVKVPKSHFETEINIRRSKIDTHDGFVNLMAKRINLIDSDININFDRDLSRESEYDRIHKLGISATKTILDNSHIVVQGAERLNTSPNPKMKSATMYLVGDLEGRNRSSLDIKSHQGYTLMTDGKSTIKGEKDKKDLSITLINTGPKPSPEIGISGSIDNDANGSNIALAIGDVSSTTIENATVSVFAPNGAVSYLSSDYMPLTLKNTDFRYYEQPRYHKLNESDLKGNGNIQKLTEREYHIALDQHRGIAATNLSTSQANLVENNKKGVTDTTPIRNIEDEENVSLTVCDEKNQCETTELGDQHINTEVQIGDLNE
ncbi:MAG: filamentous hemagglutinin N-terminal domain-containing protein [[Pasteurella] mairii]|uniref:Heme:hemopexin utilization protein A n=1 Tax=[Pasteurella] mairii TaxID=757 RepID=A0A379B1Q7_9PAST|nr:filamentous hemagglutinin N-terminal domain-containing protein [[Pasteurella] mairii]SUB32565.1 Heme:hemopexin utilization protein A [[Pasteurella] mairii]